MAKGAPMGCGADEEEEDEEDEDEGRALPALRIKLMARVISSAVRATCPPSRPHRKR